MYFGVNIKLNENEMYGHTAIKGVYCDTLSMGTFLK